MSAGRPNMILVEKIRLDGDTQARVKLDDEAIADYAERMKSGVDFPRVVVFFDGEHHWLADGFHRVRAAISINKRAIKAEVIKGTREEAIWYAVGANKANGIRFTRDDKKNACHRALKLHPEHSDRLIAGHVGVSENTVAIRRRELITNGTIPSVARIGKDDRKYEPPKENRTKGATAQTAQSRTTSYKSDSDDKPPSQQALALDPIPTVANPPVVEIDQPPKSTVPEIDPIPTPTEPDQPPSSLPVDRLGKPIQDDVLADRFVRGGELADFCREVSALKRKALDLVERNPFASAWVVATAVEVNCDNLRSMFANAQPYAVCPYCGGGANCKACQRTGFVNELLYLHAPKELKK